ncbi:hypothetical protein BFP72_13225 [Reichenbachiella sp. 5M10]|nr:hypothetical protein BFP72_13225 [Reichenbachiella sp. 5M10]
MEVEPNNTTTNATLIDQGFATYQGTVAVDGSDTDVWDIIVQDAQGKIELTITDLADVSSVTGGTADGITFGAWIVVQSGGITGSDHLLPGTHTYTWDPSRGVVRFRIVITANNSLPTLASFFPGIPDPIPYSITFGSETTITLDAAPPTGPSISPGGVSGSNLWLAADKGVTNNGGALTAWDDQTGTNTFTSTGNIENVPQAVNFNPTNSITNGSNKSGLPANRLDGNTEITISEAYAVYKFQDQGNEGVILGGQFPVGSGGGVAVFAGFARVRGLTSDGTNALMYGSHDQTSTFSITNLDFSTTDPRATSRINGNNVVVQPISGGDFSDIQFTPMIGGSNKGSSSNLSHMNGQLAELITYPTSLSGEDRKKVESYLAIKYGITLDPSVSQYLASDGTAVWNYTSYWHDVFGIGSDSDSGLEQASSNSINTGSGDGTGQSGKGNIVISNASSLENGDFLMTGHDGSNLTFGSSSQLARKWKAKRTADVGTVDLSFDLHGLTYTGSVSSDFKMLIDADGDGNFNTGTTTKVVPASLRDSVLQFTGVNLPDGAVFTFSDKSVPAFVASTDETPNRIIVNPSFETGSIVPHAAVEYPQSQAGDSPQLDGWYTTHPDFLFRGTSLKKSPIEHWRSGNQGVPASDGDYFVELNVSESSRLYQIVYLVNGETINWSYAHRARVNTNETVVYAVYSTDGNTKVKEINRHQATSTSAWDDVTGSFVWNLPTGIYQIGFESTTSGGTGNFLDNVTIGLKAFVEFSRDTIRLSEGGAIAPYFLVNGQVQSTSSFQVTVSSGDAVEGTDYQFANKTKSIPVGNYGLADSISLDFDIIDNSIPQNNRTIVLNISNTSGDVDQRDANSDGIYQQTLVVIIEDDDACKDPGTDGTLSFCATGATDIDLFAGLQGTVDTGGTWSDDSTSMVNLTDASNVDFSSLAEGTYGFTYSFPQSGICAAHQASVAVTIERAFPAGEDNSIDICNTETSVDLFSHLGGSPLTGGNWVQETGTTIDISDPADVDFSGVAAGSYTFDYVLAKQPTCDGKIASAHGRVTVNVGKDPDPGDFGTVTACTDKIIDLVASLGGTPDAGGYWTDADATGVDISDPTNVDFTSIAAGSYEFGYFVNGTNGCPTNATNVKVKVDTDLNPGTAATDYVCNFHGYTINLIGNLGGSTDQGGTWADTDGTGVSLAKPNEVSFEGVAAGDYVFTYTLSGDADCSDQSQTVTVTVYETPDAGADKAVSICEGGSSTILNLFTSLGGSPDGGGTWTDVDNAGVTLGDGTAVEFDGIASGQYDFQYEVSNFCHTESAIVTVNIDIVAHPGSNSRRSICEGGTADITKFLLGNPDAGGTWTETSPVSSGADISDITSVSFAGVAPGDYEFTYTLAGDGSCQDQSAIVYLNIMTQPDAGTDGNITVCNGNTTPINLYDQLGGTPDAGGEWHDISRAADFVSGDLASFSNTAAGTYRFIYIVNGSDQVCGPYGSSVYVTVEDAPNAGTDSHIAVCDGGTGTVKDLFGSLGGSPDNGGTWTDLDGSGADISDPTAVEFNAIAAGNYNFRYVLTAAGSCANDTSVVSVTVDQDPNTGTNTSKTICNGMGNAQSINLLDQMEGSPATGGTWAFTSTETFDISDPTQANISGASGTYELTYTISGTGTCSDASSTLTLEIEGDPYAGDRSQVNSVCTSGSTIVDLTALLGSSVDTGGTWSDVDASGIDLTDPTAVDFAGLTAGDYDFSYTVTNTCGTDVATNTITVVAASDAGTNGTLAVCNDDTAVNLLAALGGTPETGGYWSDNSSSGITLGDGTSVDFSNLTAGQYTFSYQVQDSPCAPDVATVTVTVNSLPYAGVDNTVLLCNAGNLTVDFTTAIQTTTSLTAEWTDTNNTGVDLSDPTSVDFTGVANGTYAFVHTVTGQGNCTNSSATLTVHINENGNPGMSASINSCSGSTIDLPSAIGVHDQGGTWSDDDNTGVDLFDPQNVVLTNLSSGSYDFTYTLSATSGCSNGASTTVTVVVDRISDSGQPNSISVCDASNVNLFTSLDGTPDTGGSWVESTNSNVDFTDPTHVDFSGVSSGRYEFFYIQDAPNCTAVATQLVVNIGQTINAGTDAQLDICGDNSTYNLVTLLDNPDPGGSWVDTDNSGIDLSNPESVTFTGVSGGSYRITHTHAGENGCATSQAVLTVKIAEPANAGTNNVLALCGTETTTVNFFAQLGGSPTAGGVWSDMNTSGVSLTDPTQVDISALTAGNYQYNYTVNNANTCTPAVATLTLEISTQSNTGIPDIPSIEACNGANAIVDLTANLSTGFDMGGVWTVNGQTISDPTQFDASGFAVGYYEVNYDFPANGTCSTASARYNINILEGVSAGDPGSSALCNDSGPISLFDIIAGSYNTGGTWTELTSSGADISDPTAVSFQDIDAGTYQFQYEVSSNGNCSGDDLNTVTVNLSNQPSAGQGNSVTVGLGGLTYFNLLDSLQGNPDNNGVWTDDSNSGVDLSQPDSVNFADLPDGAYSYIYSISADPVCTPAASILNVSINLQADESKVEPLEGFSPNGDGINDTWQIQYIDQYPNNRVRLYNRWGHLVFEMKGYDNNTRVFTGQSNNGNGIGDNLPDGTYFYLIELGDSSTAMKGYITIVK